MNDIATAYLADAIDNFRGLKKLADRAIAQVGDDQFFATLDEESNSIAIIMKHLAGNMRSRWRDFLNSDGEKADRHRDTEFEMNETRADIEARWEEGWQILFDALEPLTPDDVLRTITIRSEPHTVLQAVNRQIAHYGQHVGQIVLLAKHAAGAQWQTLSVPRGKSEEFNAAAASASRRSSVKF